MNITVWYILIVHQVTSRDISTFSFITSFWGATRSSFISLVFIKIYSCKVDNFWWIFDMRLELKQTNYLPQAPALTVSVLCKLIHSQPLGPNKPAPQISWLRFWLYAEKRTVSWWASNYDNDKESPQLYKVCCIILYRQYLLETKNSCKKRGPYVFFSTYCFPACPLLLSTSWFSDLAEILRILRFVNCK